LSREFSLEELENLAFDLGAPFETLQSDQKNDFVPKLMAYCEQRSVVNSLLAEVIRNRPGASDEFFDLYARLGFNSPQKRIQLIIPGNAATFTSERQQEFLAELARMMKVDIREIELTEVAEGSRKLELVVSERVYAKLLQLLLSGDNEFLNLTTERGTSEVGSLPANQAYAVSGQVDYEGFRATLRRAISSFCDDNDIQNICFDMNIDYENIPGNHKDAKVRELIRYCERQAKIDQLMAIFQAIQPNVKLWVDPASEAVRITLAGDAPMVQPT
jgi:hypothetical protein